MKQILITLITVTTFMLNGCSSTDKVDVQASGADNGKLVPNSGSSSFRTEPEHVKQNSFRLDYLHYRPVQYEKQFVQEMENVHPNKGGLIYAYYTNISNEPISLAHWRWNDFDESVWRLDNLICWDRHYESKIDPGQTSVLEINAISNDFAENRDYKFEIISKNTWESVFIQSGKLIEDQISIPLIRFKKGLMSVEIHIRNKGDKSIIIDEIEIMGKQVISSKLVGKTLKPNGHAIGRVDLKTAFKESELAIVKVNIIEQEKIRSVMAHRRAFADYFPIGTWGATQTDYLLQRQHHIDTCVKGSDLKSNFYNKEAKKFGYKSLATVNYNDTHSLRNNGENQAIACLQLSDEPDWVTHPQQVLLQDSIARNAYPHAPTMTTLCRNVTFFEYAPIVDLPCMDHYCVTAPSTSKWPAPFGTKLEETGYYTRDLKIASEPKPIWVWSQGLFDWDERPEQSVPTPGELAVQLIQNIGSGAKGILWFTFREKPGLEYPETRKAIQGWGRVLRLIREDVLGAEPMVQDLIDSPNDVDVFALVSFNKVILCVTNKDYKMHPKGYKFKNQKKSKIKIDLPSWITPKSIVNIFPTGIKEMDFEINEKRNIILEINDLHDAMLIVMSNHEKSGNAFKARFKSMLLDEKRDFSKGSGGFVKSFINGKSVLDTNPAGSLIGTTHSKINPDNIYIDISQIQNSTGEVSEFIKYDSLRIGSYAYAKKLDHECYLNLDGLVVLKVINKINQTRNISVHQENLNFIRSIPAKSTGTFIWSAQ